jgi:hypothetical protein
MYRFLLYWSLYEFICIVLTVNERPKQKMKSYTPNNEMQE